MRHGWKRNSNIVLAASSVLAAALPAAAQLSLQQALLLRSHGASQAVADAPLPTAPNTTEAALHELADQAAVIFTGEVLRVLQDGNSMQIDLRVDDGIRGVATNATYTLHEWTGLWSTASEHMRVGQRALFLLHAPSVGGFSSPVGGPDGIIPLSGDQVSGAVDLRWIAARVQRSAAPRPENAPDGTAVSANTVYAASFVPIAATPAHQASATANGIAWPADATNGNLLGPDLRRIDTGLVSGLLRAWTNAAAASAAAQ